MVKMQKLGGGLWLNGAYVKAVKKQLGKCVLTFIEAPHLEENEKFKNKSYHVQVKLPEVEILEKDENGKPTKYGKATGEMIEMTWNMNIKTSNFLADKFNGDTDNFKGQQIEVDTVRTSTTEGMVDSIYPAEMLEEAEE